MVGGGGFCRCRCLVYLSQIGRGRVVGGGEGLGLQKVALLVGWSALVGVVETVEWLVLLRSELVSLNTALRAWLVGLIVGVGVVGSMVGVVGDMCALLCMRLLWLLWSRLALIDGVIWRL